MLCEMRKCLPFSAIAASSIACTSLLGDFSVDPAALPLGADSGALPDATVGLDAAIVDGAIGDGSNEDGAKKEERTGTFKWLFQLPTATGAGAFVSPDGTTTVVGTFSSPSIDIQGTIVTKVPGSDANLLVLQLDGSGKLKWAKAYGQADFNGMWPSAVSVSGNVVIVTGGFSGGSPVTWNAIPNSEVRAAGGDDVAPFIIGIDSLQSDHPILWGKTTAPGGFGQCTDVSAPVAGLVSVVCAQPEGNIQVRGNASAQLIVQPASPTGYAESVVVATLQVADGSAVDAELIYGLQGRPSVAMGADGSVYLTAVPTVSPLSYTRAKTKSDPFVLARSKYALLKVKPGGGATWAQLWGAQGATQTPRVAVDGANQPWVSLPLEGRMDLGPSPDLQPQGPTDWAIARFSAADGSVGVKRSYGGSDFDTVYGLGFDSQGDLALLGEGSQFALEGANVPAAPTSTSQKLVLAKIKSPSGPAIWLQTATMSKARAFEPQQVRLSVGPYTVVAGNSSASIDFTATATVTRGLLVAAFER
jgi:hypothetical protein